MNALEYSATIYDIVHGSLPKDAPQLPDNAPVLAMFLEKFRPGEFGERELLRMTSMDIVRLLESSCPFTVSDVAKMMVYLGYELDVDDELDCHWLLVPTQLSGQPMPDDETDRLTGCINRN